MRSAIALDGQHDPDTLHSIEQGLPTNYVTMHVTGLIQATKGQRISAAVNSPDDLSYSVYVRPTLHSRLCASRHEMGDQPAFTPFRSRPFPPSAPGLVPRPQRESSFSLLRLQTPMAFAADLAATTQIRTEDYVTVQNWRTTGSPGVFDTTNGAFDGASGVFTVSRSARGRAGGIFAVATFAVATFAVATFAVGTFAVATRLPECVSGQRCHSWLCG